MRKPFEEATPISSSPAARITDDGLGICSSGRLFFGPVSRLIRTVLGAWSPLSWLHELPWLRIREQRIRRDAPAQALAASHLGGSLLGSFEREAGGAAGLALKVLQYHRVEDREGFAASDLSQHPTWLRVLIVTCVLALGVAIAYFAFRGAIFVKGEVGGAP